MPTPVLSNAGGHTLATLAIKKNPKANCFDQILEQRARSSKGVDAKTRCIGKRSNSGCWH